MGSWEYVTLPNSARPRQNVNNQTSGLLTPTHDTRWDTHIHTWHSVGYPHPHVTLGGLPTSTRDTRWVTRRCRQCGYNVCKWNTGIIHDQSQNWSHVLNVHNSFTLIIEKKNKNTYISWFTANRIES